MPFTRTTFLRTMKIGGAALIILVIAAYALWRSLNFARGPHITISEPADWASISASTTIVRGRVERANGILLNGKAIFIDEEGNFNETLIVFPGVNVITLVAHDQFDRDVSTQLRIFRK